MRLNSSLPAPIRLRALLGLAWCFGFAAGGWAQDPGPPSAEIEVTAPAERVAVGNVADDGQIGERLTGILQSTAWFGPINVTVRDGVVFLAGQTDTAAHQQWAGDLAQRTQDVVAVVNRITVTERSMWDFSMAWDELRMLRDKMIRGLPTFVFAMAILALAWWASKRVATLARAAFEGRLSSPLIAAIASRLVAIPLFLIGLYVVLQVAGLTPLALTLLGGTGVMGIVIGFAFRDIAENFLASVLLSVRRPFRPNDVIEVAGHTGIVQRMNTRVTVLMTMEGNHVQIPNATIFKNTIINFTANPNRRSDFAVGIGYDDSITTAQELIAAMLNKHPAVLKNPEPMVLVEALGASTVNLRIYYWFDATRIAPLKLKSSLQRLTKRTLTDAQISMPDEAREVVFPQGVPIIMQSSTPPVATPPAPAPAAPATLSVAAVAEPVSMEAEGQLHSETPEVQEQADACPQPEGGPDLLRAT